MNNLSQPEGSRWLGLSPVHWLVLSVVVGCGARIYYTSIQAGLYFPDQLFQYVEPGNFRATGLGRLYWEFQDGARNWILPWFWGALIKLLSPLHLTGWELYRVLAYFNAGLSLVLIPAAFRLGWALSRGRTDVAALTALVTAACPFICVLSGNTLSEVPAMVALTWAGALWIEDARLPASRWRGAWIGV
ncbi:MAG: hypothetical protein KC561_11085, partial [Myxococcales bacterium]|nr:hypothetical protein [Myxococcales bacterium]